MKTVSGMLFKYMVWCFWISVILLILGIFIKDFSGCLDFVIMTSIYYVGGTLAEMIERQNNMLQSLYDQRK